jgi:HK97 family phage prohead protease
MEIKRPEYASFFGVPLTKTELHSEGDSRTLVGYATAFDFPVPGDNGETIYIRPNSLNKTLRETRDQLVVLYHHGKDPQIGSKPLGKPKVVDVQKYGLWTETPLAKTAYNEQIVIPLLEDGTLNSMSIQFATMQQSWNREGTERYIEQMALVEFGPTPMPRNLGATAALHSFDVDALLELHWDGNAAMRSCSSAAEFRKVAFERSNDSDPDTAAHWALPHHPSPDGAPANADPQGVAAALAALHGGRTGTPMSGFVQPISAIESHLNRHQAETSQSWDRESIPDGDRVTWTVRAWEAMERNALDVETETARIARLG